MTHGIEAPASYATLPAAVQPRTITNEAEAQALQAHSDRLIDQPDLTEAEEDLHDEAPRHGRNTGAQRRVAVCWKR